MASVTSENTKKTEDHPNLRGLSGPLLRWYGQHARNLLWRQDPTPYKVWISEIMLQQTRVETVTPYFERFLEAFPDIKALAGAEEDRLLKLWEGLGYYSRARNIQKAAKILVESCGGRLPETFSELRRLPGIGPYTAGAIASIAFSQPVPAVDGNVLRVLARLLASGLDIRLPANRRFFEEAAIQMLPPERPGDFNQAMMELGATVCLPNTEPKCFACPVSSGCEAFRTGTVREYPVRSANKPRAVLKRTVFVVISGGRVLLRRRDPVGLLAGMWEFPGEDAELSDSEARQILERLGAAVRKIKKLPAARHIFTHIEWDMGAYLAYTDPFSLPAGWVWASETDIRKNYALPSAYSAYSRRLHFYLKEKSEESISERWK